MKVNIKSLISACFLSYVFIATSSEAANWLMLQGTELEGAAPRVKFWGFIQAQYQKDNSDANVSNTYIPPKLIGPDLSSQEQFNINRARIGARGTGFPLDSKVNYFFLAEFGNNGITALGDRNVRVTDASITLNHIKGARLRFGLFKAPMSEEAWQAIHVFDYINFTTVTNQLLLERFPNREYTANNPPVALPAPQALGAYTQPVGAFRDMGFEVFDTFKKDDWEHSYAVMVGNGNGLNFGDNDDNKDIYLYWSSEQVYGGKGPRRQGLKFFAWNLTGKRQLDATDDSIHNPVEYDRDRNGLGMKYLKKPWRVSFEFMTGEGMIFVGPDKPTFDMNPAAPAGNGENGEASGWYVDGGWYIPNSKWELDVRYDVYNRLENDTIFPSGPNAGKNFEIEFTTLTIGAQYEVNKKTRIIMDIENRNAEAVDFAAGTGPNAELDGVDRRFAIQLTHIF